MIKLSRVNHSQEIEILRSKLGQAVAEHGLNSPQALRTSMALDVLIAREQGRLWSYEQREAANSENIRQEPRVVTGGRRGNEAVGMAEQ